MYNQIPTQKSKYIVLTYEIILPIVIILAVIAGGYLTLKSQFFAVREIKCSLDYQPCPDGAITAELAKYKNQNLLRLGTAEISSRLTAGDFMIREVVFKKQLPSTLLAELQSVYPVVATMVEGVDNEWLVFDQKHRVIGLRQTDPNVPTVILQTSPVLRVGEQITDSQITQALELAVEIDRDLTGVISTTLEGDTVYIELENDKTAVMTTAKERALQIRTLQAILADNTIDAGVRIIDVRFSKPVLKSN